MIDKQKLIDDLKNQIESNKKYIRQLQSECGSNYILIQELYGNLIANLNGQNTICESLIKSIEKGRYKIAEEQK